MIWMIILGVVSSMSCVCLRIAARDNGKYIVDDVYVKSIFNR